MDSNKVEFYKNLLKDYIVIKDEVNAYSMGAKIVEIKKHFDNGKLLKHDNKSIFGIAFFNAFTIQGAEEVMKALRNNFDHEVINLLIKKHTLFQYMPENSIRYKKWKVGDFGNITYVKNTNNEFRVDFANLSLIERENRKII